jgi:hypothetical protein
MELYENGVDVSRFVPEAVYEILKNKE